jgi:hypothetical protein
LAIAVIAAMAAPSSAVAAPHHHHHPTHPRHHRKHHGKHHRRHHRHPRPPLRGVPGAPSVPPFGPTAGPAPTPTPTPLVAVPPTPAPPALPAPGVTPATCTVPGATAAFSDHSYALEGEDTFTKAAPTGTFASTDANAVVYTGDHGMGWTSYPDGWSSTYTGGAPGYEPSTVLSVHDGMLDYALHTDAAGHPVGANPSPLPGGNRYQTYGAWSLCERIVPNPGSDLADFYHVPLLWPANDGDGPAAESDFPEGNMTNTTFSAFAHHSGGQDAFSTGAIDSSAWHAFTQTWNPGQRSYYVDGRLIGTTTTSVWSGPERWQMQMEPSGSSSDGGSGHVQVSWVWIGTPS